MVRHRAAVTCRNNSDHMTDQAAPTPQRPTALPLIPENVPALLRETPRWVLWRFTLVERGPQGGQKRKVWAKVPKQPNGRNAKSTDPLTWCTWAQALAAYQTGRFDGVGFIFDGSDGLVGVDLDDVREVDVLDGTTTLEPVALDALARLPGYWEVSPSGTGIKGWINAPGIGAQKNDDLGIEVYDAGRYFAVTGHEVACAVPILNERPWPDIEPELNAWIEQHLGSVAPKRSGALVQVTGDPAFDAFLQLSAEKPAYHDWDADRIRREIVPYLDIECHYEDWVRCGMILHHQFEGEEEGFELWEEIFSGSSKYTGEDNSRERWVSFGKRGAGANTATLGTLIKQTAAAREKAAAPPIVRGPATAAARLEVEKRLAGYLRQIEGTQDAHNLEALARERMAKDREFTDTDKAQLVAALQKQAKALGLTTITLPTIRKWLKRAFTGGFGDLSADGRALHTQGNLQTLCEQLDITVRYNVIAKRDEIQIPNASWSVDNADAASVAQLYSECQKAELPLPLTTLKNYVTMMGDLNPWNAPLAWVESRPWDGVDRVTALIDTIKSPMEPDLKRTLMEHWLVSAIVALKSPVGVMARGVLVFQGAQYQGKTRWLSALAPALEIGEQVTRSGVMLDLRNKDSVKQAVSYWLVELGELEATFNRSEIGALKAWLSNSVDVLRKPYAAAESTFARRTVYFATVNADEFLYDTTGNTRFWTIPVDELNPDHGIDMQQVWAQVADMQVRGHLHYPTNATMARLNVHNATFEAEDALMAKVRDVFAWDDPLAQLQWLSSAELLALVGVTRPSRGDAMAVSRIVRTIAGRDAVRRSHGKRQFRVPLRDDSLM